MYLEHFKLQQAPFSLTPNTDFYCELPTHQDALAVLLLSLKEGEGFIKIVGEVGTGKTLICRMLLNQLSCEYVVAYIPNPDLDSDGLRRAVAYELGIKNNQSASSHELLEMINQRLKQFHKEGKKPVLIIDEAQALPDECLEAVRLLTNLETEAKKLLQVVLFGQPELDLKLRQSRLRQLRQRITFSYNLKPLAKKQLDAYLCHRLAKAGYTYGSLFTGSAKKKLFEASGGLPRLLNVLCHKSLLVAYGRGQRVVDKKSMKRAIKDTENVISKAGLSANQLYFVLIALATAAACVWAYSKFGLF